MCFLTFAVLTFLLDESEFLNVVTFSQYEVLDIYQSIYNLTPIITFCFLIKIAHLAFHYFQFGKTESFTARGSFCL